MHESLRGPRWDAENGAHEPAPSPPAWLAAQCRARVAAQEPAHPELLRLVMFLAESIRGLWGCFWPASQSVPLSPLLVWRVFCSISDLLVNNINLLQLTSECPWDSPYCFSCFKGFILPS